MWIDKVKYICKDVVMNSFLTSLIIWRSLILLDTYCGMLCYIFTPSPPSYFNRYVLNDPKVKMTYLNLVQQNQNELRKLSF